MREIGSLPDRSFTLFSKTVNSSINKTLNYMTAVWLTQFNWFTLPDRTSSPK